MARARANGPETLRLNRTSLAVVAGALLLAGCQQTVAFKLLDAGGGGSRGMAGAAGTAGFGGMAGFGNAGGDGDVCPIGQRVMPTPEYPIAIVALDRTTTMTAPLGPPGSGSKLDAVRAALVRLVDQYAIVIRFGFVGFPGKGPSPGGSCSASGECCSSIAPPSVFSATFNGAMGFERAIGESDFTTGSDRQIAAALSSSLTAFGSDPYGGDVVLITDGGPGCGADACKDAQTAASLLNQKGELHILGLGPPAADAESCLRTLATANQYDSADPKSPKDLANKLGGIIQRIASQACTVDLNIAPDQVSGIRVFQYGQELSQGSEWKILGGFIPSITLYGRVCENFVGYPDATVICRP